MLHLKDQICIENMSGESDWGYTPNQFHFDEKDLQRSIDRDNYETPHCYNCDTESSVIRINANGRDLLQILEDSTLSEVIKNRALSGSLDVIKAIVTSLITRAVV
jgi:hypothetical protein